jgi:DNA-binding winged helix-turn-helix (wHTH) protein
VDVHVRRLRAKLGPEHEQLIGTVRNVGYKFVRPGRAGLGSRDSRDAAEADAAPHGTDSGNGLPPGSENGELAADLATDLDSTRRPTDRDAEAGHRG